jgi:hypothetical protein
MQPLPCTGCTWLLHTGCTGYMQPLPCTGCTWPPRTGCKGCIWPPRTGSWLRTGCRPKRSSASVRNNLSPQMQMLRTDCKDCRGCKDCRPQTPCRGWPPHTGSLLRTGCRVAGCLLCARVTRVAGCLLGGCARVARVAGCLLGGGARVAGVAGCTSWLGGARVAGVAAGCCRHRVEGRCSCHGSGCQHDCDWKGGCTAHEIGLECRHGFPPF